MGNEGVKNDRPFTESGALEPCASLGKPWAGSCALWISQWWLGNATEKNDDKKLIARMGEWCRAMPGGKSVYDLCLEGIARRMRWLTNDRPELTHDRCTRATNDTDNLYRCQLLSALRFAYYYPPEKAARACEGLPDEKSAPCRKAAEAEAMRLQKNNATYSHETPLNDL